MSAITHKEALNRVIEHREIFYDEMLVLMRQIMSGEMSPVMMAALITGLRVKKETIGEIAAAATVMREFSTKVPVTNTEHMVDIVGTGGDASSTFNISTTAAFVAAAAGARVAKHGGRSVSSKSGSADVLESLGIDINLSPENVARAVDSIGVGFMFAPNFHGAMKYAAPVRKELGVRTLFNILGPLTNPAGAPNYIMGVFHPDLVGIQARVLQRLGARHALVVYGQPGLDEISISGETLVAELRDDEVREYTLQPSQFGLATCELSALQVSTMEESRDRVLKVLDNVPGPERDIVMLNAGAAIYAAGVAESLASGVERAREVLANGQAKARLEALRSFA